MTVEERTEPRTLVERLITEVFAADGIVCTVTAGNNLSIAELMGRSAPRFGGGWWTVETAGWHIHAQLDAIRSIAFVREPSDHVPGQESLSIRLVGPNGESLLRAYFVNLYDKQTGQPNPAQFQRWEAMRERFTGGRCAVAIERGEAAG
ncbi:MAG: hypothetical protein HY331_14340 [Chloroflexi bacterium]|nr:hypothetical protein [Chloroflexota bacterium]